jgi:hypothetical protein
MHNYQLWIFTDCLLAHKSIRKRQTLNCINYISNMLIRCFVRTICPVEWDCPSPVFTNVTSLKNHIHNVFNVQFIISLNIWKFVNFFINFKTQHFIKCTVITATCLQIWARLFSKSYLQVEKLMKMISHSTL